MAVRSWPEVLDPALRLARRERKAREQAVYRRPFQSQLLSRVVIQSRRIVSEIIVLITNTGVQQKGGRKGVVKVQALHVRRDERADGGGNRYGQPVGRAKSR